MSGAVMSGVVLTGHGGPEKLVWRDDLPRPVPGPGEVLVRVGASAVNNTDINTRLAWYSRKGAATDDASWTGVPLGFPRIQGIDACGEVVGLGPGAADALLGRRVLIEPCLIEVAGQPVSPPWFLGSECDGGFAEYLTVAARHAHPVECDLSDVELATFPCSYATAENLLTRAGARAGDRALVTGASGGVGSAVVQLLAARGADVVAVSTPQKAATLKVLGAGRVIGRGDDPAATCGAESFDLVVDLVGGAGFPALLAALRRGGRYAVAGAVAGAEVPLDLRTLYLKDLSFFGCTVLGTGVFAALVRRIETKEIKPLLAEVFPLRDIAAAQAAFAEKSHVGKIGLRIAS